MNTEFIYALKQIEKEKNIPIDILIEGIEMALISAYKRNFNHKEENVSVQVDRETGETEVYQHLTVVDEVTNTDTEISLKEAREYDETVEVGDEIEAEVTPSDFGRIAAQTAKQVIMQRIKEAERDIIYKEYADKAGSILTGIFQRYENKNVLLDVGKIECIIPVEEQTETEHFKYSDKIKVYVLEVNKAARGPQIVGSRTHTNLVARLFELEVPEIHQGVIVIKNAVREPGSRTKLSVASRDSNVDPVGACVGPKGSRVKTVVEELRGEKLDIISWSEDSSRYIASALSPAKAQQVIIYEHTSSAYVIVPDDQLSLAIGKDGQNVRLAARLTGWKIDIKSETQAKEDPPPPPPTAEELRAIKEAKQREEQERIKKEEERLRLEKELTPEKLALLEIEESKAAPGEEVKTGADEIKEEKAVAEETAEETEKDKYKKKEEEEKERDIETGPQKKKIKKPKRARYMEYDQEEEYSEYYRKFEE